MTSEVDIGMLITRDPAIRGGRPYISGTGVTVQRIVGWYKLGLGPEEISDRIGHISLAQVYAALAYYHANKPEIETLMNDDNLAADKAESEYSQTQRAS